MSDSDGFEGGNHIVTLFDQGKQFTEELLQENERLRLINKNLQQENRALTSELSSSGVASLKETVARLEQENASLKKAAEDQRRETESMEAENREFADRYVEVERQNSDLISMYVASYQLHSTLDYDDVVKAVKDITINMLGGEIFGLYEINRDSKDLKLIAHEGMEGREGPIPLDDESVRDVIETGEARFVESKAEYADGNAPVACLPLKLGEDPYGLIVIHKLLIQKEGFRALDFELVELLGKHAASAIYSAKLHLISERKRNTLEGFVDLIKGTE